MPFLIGVYNYFFEPNSFTHPRNTERALSLIQWFAIPSLLSVLQYLPVFRFKKMNRVSKDQALLKIPFLELYLWFFAGIMLFFLFGGSLSIISNSARPLYVMFGIGLSFSTISIVILNSNKILFQGDYRTDKALKEDLRKQTTDGYFTYQKGGFTFKHKKKNFQTTWKQVEGIMAFKTDSFSYDTIHLIIKSDNQELNIGEDTEGWFVFKNKLKAHLQPINSNWEFEVMFPPFEESATWVYKKGEKA